MRKLIYAAKLHDGRTIPISLEDVKPGAIPTQETLDASFFNYAGTYNGKEVELNTVYGKDGNSTYAIKVPSLNLEIKQSDVAEIIRSPFIVEGRYALFMGLEYYPLGGIWDLIYCSDSIEDLEVIARDGGIFAMYFSNDWAHIVDMHTLEIVKKLGCFK